MLFIRFMVLILAVLPVLPVRAQVYYFGSNDRPVPESKAIKKVELKHESEKKAWIYTSIRDMGDWKEIKREKVRISSPWSHTVSLYRGKLLEHKTRRSFMNGEDGLLEFQDKRDGRVMVKGGASRKLPLQLEGKVTEYYDNGMVKSESLYRDNQLVWNKNWLRNGDKYIDSIFYSVDNWPVYLDGAMNLKTHMNNHIVESRYYSNKLSGTVRIGFTIMEDGELRGVHILNKEVTGIAAVARETFETLPGKWKPAVLDGRNVRCFMTFPVNFIQKGDDMMFQEVEIVGNMIFYNYQ